MRSIRRGDSGPAVAEIRSILVGLELLPASESDAFDADTENAVREFQQSRGKSVAGPLQCGELVRRHHWPTAAAKFGSRSGAIKISCSSKY